MTITRLGQIGVCFTALVLLAGGAGAADEGYWKLFGETEYWNKNVPPRGPARGRSDGGSDYEFEYQVGKVRLTWPSSKGARVIEWTWTSPPTIIIPGQVIPAASRVQVLKNGGNWQGTGGSVVCQITPESGMGQLLNVFGDVKVRSCVEEPGKAGKYVECENTTTSFGKGKKGDKIYLRYAASAGRAEMSVSEAYHYMWVDGTPPAFTPPAPLPPIGTESSTKPAPGSPATPGITSSGLTPPGTATAGTTSSAVLVSPGSTTPVGTAGSASPAPEPAAATHMTLQAAKRKAKTGENVTVPVWLLKGTGLIDMNFNLEYDPAVVQIAGSVVKGNLLEGADFEANPGKPGVVQIGLVPKTGGVAASEGTVAQITFKVVGQAGTKTTLRLVPRKASIAGGVAASPATIDGEIQVVDDAGLIPGDINGDGRVGMDDVMIALKISVGLLPANPRADVDNDGQVTAADARVIRNRVLGIKD